MRYAFVFLAVILCFCQPLHAQTAAQKALNAEPEIRQITAMSKNTYGQNLPDGDINKPGLLMTSGLALADLMTEAALLDNLEVRLDSQAQACHYCAAKQDELSELIQQRMALMGLATDRFGGGDPSRGAAFAKFFGATPVQTRWDDQDIAVKEARDQIDFCNQSNGRVPMCRPLVEDGAYILATHHEHAWSACFKAHNWVKTPSERLAYENCMDANDPLTQLCAAKQKASFPGTCARYSVAAFDVNPLINYQDRWIKAAPKITAAEEKAANDAYPYRPILEGSRMQTILLEPIDLNGVRAKRDFHAQLNVDMVLPTGSSDNALALPRGTDVFLKGDDDNRGIVRVATLSVDYVILNGQHVQLQTGIIRHNFPLQGPLPVGTDVLWPAGDKEWFSLTDGTQVDKQLLTQAGQARNVDTNTPSAVPVAATPDNAAPSPRPGGKGSAGALQSAAPRAPVSSSPPTTASPSSANPRGPDSAANTSSTADSAPSNPQTSAAALPKSPLGGALDGPPHSSPQEMLAGKHILVSTVDVIDLASVNAGHMFRAEVIGGDKIDSGQQEGSVYLKVVPGETANGWTILNASVDHVQYGQTSIPVSSNVQRLHVRVSSESEVRDRVVKWPVGQIEIVPKTRLSYRLGPAPAQPGK